MALINAASHGKKDHQNGKGQNNEGREHLRKFVQEEEFTIERAVEQEQVEGPDECEVGKQVCEEGRHQAGHLIWDAHAPKQDVLTDPVVKEQSNEGDRDRDWQEWVEEDGTENQVCCICKLIGHIQGRAFKKFVGLCLS